MQTAFAAAADGLPLPLRAVLIDGADPRSVPPESLPQLLGVLGLNAGELPLSAQAVLRRPEVLSCEECAVLRRAVDARRDQEDDTVDGAPDHQLNLSEAELCSLVGAEAVARIVGAAREFDRRRRGKARELPIVEVFARRYALEERPWFPLHQDRATVTVNIALSDDTGDGGGVLLGAFEDGLLDMPRTEGEATAHASTLVHGVTRIMTSRARHSLIVFFGEALPVRRELTRVEGPDGPVDVWRRVVVDADDAACLDHHGS